MYVSNLALNDYRSYRELILELPKGVVVFAGANGRGKTNLVESIAYLSTFASHRVSSSASLVRVGAEDEETPGGAVVRLRMQDEGRSTLLELEISRGRANRGRLNKSNVTPRELLGHLRVVVFAPEDLELLRGDPGTRRRFLDEIVTKIKPHYLATRQDFDRVLRQRAATLKQLGRGRSTLSLDEDAVLQIWDRQLADLSARMSVHRQAVVRALQPLVEQAYHQVTAGDRSAQVAYRPHLHLHDDDSVDDKPSLDEEGAGLRVLGGRIVGDANAEIAALSDAYFAELQRIRAQELRRGVNLEGAHRDDLEVTLDGLPVKGYASHGELWSSALTLRLAELELLRLDGTYPVLILDDVFAELDTSRRKGLIAQMVQVEQVLVTVADGTDLPDGLDAHYFRVSRDKDGRSRVEDLAIEPVPPKEAEVNPDE